MAQKTGQKAAYSKQRGFDKRYYLDLITKAISEHGSLSRKDVDELLWKKLPDWIEDRQRKVKVNNVLAELWKIEIIQNNGTFKDPEWVLIKKDSPLLLIPLRPGVFVDNQSAFLTALLRGDANR